VSHLTASGASRSSARTLDARCALTLKRNSAGVSASQREIRSGVGRW
jgi:hypothetical protein